MKNGISIDLKSHGSAGIIITLAISSLSLLYIIWFVISGDFLMLTGEGTSRREYFSFIVLSLFAITIPVVLNYVLVKTLVIKDTFVVDFEKNEISIVESNAIMKSSRVKQILDMTNYREIIYIRINEDEDGIVNNYHIFLTGPDEPPRKIYTFSKFHFVVRFIKQLSGQNQLTCIDWTDLDFEKESDFENHYSAVNH